MLQGLPVPVFGAMLETACLFFSYGELQNVIRRSSGMPHMQDLTIPQLMLASAGAGAITSFILFVRSLPSVTANSPPCTVRLSNS